MSALTDYARVMRRVDRRRRVRAMVYVIAGVIAFALVAIYGR